MQTWTDSGSKNSLTHFSLTLKNKHDLLNTKEKGIS